MDNKKPVRNLSDEEAVELKEGHDLQAMTATAGWAIVEGWLKDISQALPDPRAVDSDKDYMWRVLNAFHAQNNAVELRNGIQEKISRAEFLQKKSRGEIQSPMGVGRI